MQELLHSGEFFSQTVYKIRQMCHNYNFISHCIVIENNDSVDFSEQRRQGLHETPLQAVGYKRGMSDWLANLSFASASL